MTVREAIKRLRQETCPATICPDFDKEECLKTIENFVLKIYEVQEDLGIDIPTLVKALQPYNSAIKTKNGKFFDEKYQRDLICQGPYYIEVYKDGKYEGAISVEDYGKTWVFAGESFD